MKIGMKRLFAALIALAAAGAPLPARAQNSFTPVQNYVGAGAGLNFRTDLNNHLSGAAPITATLRRRIATVTSAMSPYALTESGPNFIRCNASGGNVTLDLPAALGTGDAYTFKRIDSSANACTIAAHGTDLIDGNATLPLTAMDQNVALIDAAVGAWDVRAAGANAFPLTSNVSAAGYKIQNLGAGSTTGDALSWGQSGAVLTTLTASNNGVLNVTAPPYNAKCDSATDAGPAINSAIAAAGASGSVFIPPCAGAYLITTPINLTMRNGFVLSGGFGAYNAGARLLCNTGSTCLDTTGSNFLVVRDLVLDAKSDPGSTPSTIGILQARYLNSSNTAQSNRFENVSVYMGSAPSANSGHGRIAVYNYGSEIDSYQHVDFEGDTGLVLSSQNSIGVASPYQTLPTGTISMQNTAVLASSSFAGNINTIWIDGVATGVDLGSPYFISGATAANHVRISGTLQNLTINGGVAEGPANLFLLDSGALLQRSHIDVVDSAMGNVSAITLTSSAGTCPEISASWLRVQDNSLASPYPSLINESGTGCSGAELNADHIDFTSYNAISLAQGGSETDLTLNGNVFPSTVSLPPGSQFVINGSQMSGNAVDLDALDLNNSASGANPWHFYSSATGSGAPWGAGGFGIGKATTNLLGIEASGALVTGTSNTQITNAAGTLRAAALDNGAMPLGATSDGGFNAVGSLNIAAVGTPAAPTVTVNTTGSTSYTYYCVALDLNGLNNLSGGLGNTLPSAGATVTNGAATPNNTITCAGTTGALGFVVLKNATNASIGSCTAIYSGQSCSVTDTGQATTAYTPNTQDETGTSSISALQLGTDTLFSETPRSLMSAIDEPGILADTGENFGSFFATKSVTVEIAKVVTELAASTCTTAPTYKLVYGSTYGAVVGTIVTACTPSGTVAGVTDCAPTATSIPASDFVWWTPTTAAASCAAKFNLIYGYRMN